MSKKPTGPNETAAESISDLIAKLSRILFEMEARKLECMKEEYRKDEITEDEFRSWYIAKNDGDLELREHYYVFCECKEELLPLLKSLEQMPDHIRDDAVKELAESFPSVREWIKIT